MNQLNTERLVIEKATLKDAPFFLKLFNSTNFIMSIGDRGLKTIKDSEEYIQNNLIDSYKKNGYGLFKMSLKENEEPVGICGFVKRNTLEHADIGFGILDEFEGKGYTFEASKAMMYYGRTTLKLRTILAVTSITNVKSQSILKKIGLHKKETIILGEKEVLFYSNEP